ncbi:MAG: hypothetical protein CME06_16640 [Gemmatimonadetes bacterium]|nr:hypothetical protein [Gemmatimonadota bacterium]
MRTPAWMSLLLINTALAQSAWEEVNNGLGDTSVRSLFAYVDTVMVGTAGGIFRSGDGGASWVDISGDIGSTSINDIRGGGAPRVIWAATDDGAYLTVDHAIYADASIGVANRNTNYYWFGDTDTPETDWALGTDGGGVYVAANELGPWTARNTGISGAGLQVNDMSGYDDDETSFTVIATEGGVYFSTDGINTWTEKNNGLTGDALSAKRLAAFGSLVMAATHGGFYMSSDLGDSWLPVIESELFNTLTFSLTAGMVLVFGESGYYSVDFVNFIPIGMSGVSGGNVTAVTVTTTHIFIGTESGGVFRLGLGEVGIDDKTPANHSRVQQVHNYPNPFNPSTTIRYSLDRPAHVVLNIYDVQGRKIRTLNEGYQVAGDHSRRLHAAGLSSGVYLLQLVLEDHLAASQRMLVVK